MLNLPDNVEKVTYPYLVIGAGLAGLNAALELAAKKQYCLSARKVYWNQTLFMLKAVLP